MLITFFPRLWHGTCAAFNAAGHGRGRTPAREIAESAEKDRDRGKATLLRQGYGGQAARPATGGQASSRRAGAMPGQAGGIPRGRDRLQDGVDGNAQCPPEFPVSPEFSSIAYPEFAEFAEFGRETQEKPMLICLFLLNKVGCLLRTDLFDD